MIYPAKVQADSNATKLVTFPDFPEAATFGEGVEEALLQAQDALLTAIAARIDDGEDVPLPSPIGDDLRPVELPAMAEATVLLGELCARRMWSRGSLPAGWIGSRPRWTGCSTQTIHRAWTRSRRPFVRWASASPSR